MEAKLSIHVSPEDDDGPRGILIKVSEDGLPAPSETVFVRLEGDGTFDSSLPVIEQVETTDEQGHAFVTWWGYPRYNPRRELNSVITANCERRSAAVEMSVLIGPNAPVEINTLP